MNKIFGLGILALSISACNSGMATNGSTEVSSTVADEMSLKARQDSLTLDSFKKAEAAHVSNLKNVDEQQALVTPAQSSEVASEAAPSASQPVAPEPEKKGWSDAAKGTAIGAGVGAGVGALIDKDKRVRGAVIGAAIGGGSGYAIGRKSDRESGRVQKK